MEAPDLRTDGELLVATASEPEAYGAFYRPAWARRTSAGEEIVSLPGARPTRPAAA
jgi:hypothetical protein